LTLEDELKDDWMYCMNESLAGTDGGGRVTIEFGRRVTVLSTRKPVSGTSSATFRFLPGDPTP
jgi:hypothetical protein